MTTLITPHRSNPPQQHTNVPFIFRSICTCGFTVWAGTAALSAEGMRQHIESEDPFPDIDLFDGMKGPHENGN